MAARAGRKQSEPDWHSSLHWSLVTACVGANQQPDTRNTTKGRNYFIATSDDTQYYTECQSTELLNGGTDF